MDNDFTPGNWITTTEAAELTVYWVTHIRRLVREGRIKSKRFGKAWMVHRDSLLAYAEEMKKLGQAKHDPWRTGARTKEAKD